MRRPASVRRKIFSFILAIGITLTVPYAVFGAARTAVKPGRARAPVHRPQSYSQHLYPYGLWDVGEVGEEQVIMIQQVQRAPVFTFREPAKKRVYVQPRWVDGGHGVQVSVPGYWIDAGQAPKR